MNEGGFWTLKCAPCTVIPETVDVPLSELLPEAEPLSVLLAFSGVSGTAAVVVTGPVSGVSEGNTVVDEDVADVSFTSGVVTAVTAVVPLVDRVSPSGSGVDSCVALLPGAKAVDCKSVRLDKSGRLVEFCEIELGVEV